MSFLESIGSFMSGGADKAALQAGGALETAGNRSARAADRFQGQALDDIRGSEKDALKRLDKGQADMLRAFKQAGQTLSEAEERSLAAYDQAEGIARGDITEGRDASIDEITQAQTGALDAVGAGRDASVSALEQGRDQGVGAIDAATGQVISGIDEGTERALGFFQPYAEAGDAAIKELADIQGLNGTDAQEAARARFRTDPGYAFRVSESAKAIENSAAARGGLQSGTTLKALQDRSQDLASQEFGNYFNRTAGLADVGFNAAGQRAGITERGTGQRTNVLSQAGRDRADIITGTAGRISGVEDLASGRNADIIGTSGARRADIRTNAGANLGNVASNFGARRGDTISSTGANVANVFTGAGENVLANAARGANVELDASGQRTGVRTNALQARTNALNNIGQAKAGGIVQASNARSQGLNNALSLAGTALSAATAPINPTSMLGQVL